MLGSIHDNSKGWREVARNTKRVSLQQGASKFPNGVLNGPRAPMRRHERQRPSHLNSNGMMSFERSLLPADTWERILGFLALPWIYVHTKNNVKQTSEMVACMYGTFVRSRCQGCLLLEHRERIARGKRSWRRRKSRAKHVCRVVRHRSVCVARTPPFVLRRSSHHRLGTELRFSGLA
jgi:hypothetical protein